MTIGEKVLELAIQDIGVKESPAGSNNVKYNTWFYGRPVSGNSFPWCMAAVEYWYNAAGHPLPYKTASCSALLNWYRENEPQCIVTAPAAGDIVILAFYGKIAHTGIFERDLGGGYISVIEGNTSLTSDDNGGAVMRRVRARSLVRGYIRPFYNNNEEEKPMTGEEIYKALNDYTATLPLPEWAKEEYAEAVKAGITDGTNPMGLIPRYQVALMCLRASKKAVSTVVDALVDDGK